MSVESRSITLQNLQDVVDVLNGSSLGTSVEQKLDPGLFFVLANRWNFSYEHSMLSYDDGRPVAIIINCADRESNEAYTFYWGAVPSARQTRIALHLFEASCRKLREDGFTTLYGDAVPDRPVKRYRFIHAVEMQNLLQMQAADLVLPQPDTPFEIRQLDPADLSQIPWQLGEHQHWTQRAHFARSASSSVQVLGAFKESALQAYTTVLPQSELTTILDLRSRDSSPLAGHALLRSLIAQKYRLPFVATNVPDNSYTQQVLSDANFRIEKRYVYLCRQLA